MEKEINPYTDQDIEQVEIVNPTSRFGSNIIDSKEMQIGFGSKVFRADESGIWLGAETFALAPFSVNMLGNITATGLTLGSLSGNLDDIDNGTLYAKTTLNEVIGSGRAYNGLNSAGEIIQGFLNSQLSSKSLPFNGVRFDADGIYGRKSGNTTFYLSNTGDAYFKGDITASSMTASTISGNTISGGTITGTTITGGVIQTQSSGIRTVLDGGDSKLKFMFDNTVFGYLYPMAGASNFGISMVAGDVELGLNDGQNTAWLIVAGGYGLDIDSGGHTNFSRFVRLARLSSGTASGLSPVNGSMYYRTDDNVIRVYLNGTWRTITTT